MLQSLNIKNFTAFADANLRFSNGLNVFVGENGVGKSHLLKLPYAVMAALTEPRLEARHTKSMLQRAIGEKLVNVMRPEALGRLARRPRGRQRCEVALTLGTPRERVCFSFATQTKFDVILDEYPPKRFRRTPVFLPTRELLSIYPGFSALYDSRHLEFEETWRDTCQRLGAPTLKGPRAADAREILTSLEDLMGGRLTLEENGRFYLRTRQGSMEVPLVAEGVRKLGMLARLVATDSLAKRTSLFWDEPETNLNPKLIKGVAEAILQLVGRGVQVLVATHSLFLLREFELLHARPQFNGSSCRYFALAAAPEVPQSDGPAGVVVAQGNALEDVDPLVLLDEELHQSDRYLDADA